MRVKAADRLGRWRIAFDVRFRHSPHLLSAPALLIDTAVGTKPGWHWSTGAPQTTITVETPDRSLRLTSRIDRANVVAEYPADEAVFNQHAWRWVGKVLELGRVTQSTRLGTQFTYLMPVSDFDTTVDHLRTTWFTDNAEWWSRFGGPAADIALPLTLRIGDKTGGFLAGPMTEREARGRFKTDGARDAIKGPQVFLDLDMHSDAATPIDARRPESACRTFYRDAAAEIERIMRAVAETLPDKEGE